jgi:hypothetical protein
MQPTTNTRLPDRFPTSTAAIGRPRQERPSETERPDAGAATTTVASGKATKTRKALATLSMVHHRPEGLPDPMETREGDCPSPWDAYAGVLASRRVAVSG